MIYFEALKVTAPDRSIIGLIRENGTAIEAAGITRFGPEQALPAKPGNYILDQTLARAGAFEKARVVRQLIRLRRAGATIVLISHDEPLLESCVDEIWWIDNGRLIAWGDPSEVLARYRRHVSEVLRESGEGQIPETALAMRKGDGRAAIERIEILGEAGESTTVLHSGEDASVRIAVRFKNSVGDPVVGIMIRNRIGLNVYGTNTELERIKLGPIDAGAVARVTYNFPCALCPGEYTVTAASHDPDGLWHDWLEDAVAFSVVDSRYTAGVANLRARVKAEVEIP